MLYPSMYCSAIYTQGSIRAVTQILRVYHYATAAQATSRSIQLLCRPWLHILLPGS